MINLRLAILLAAFTTLLHVRGQIPAAPPDPSVLSLSASGDSFPSGISSDGRFVLFTSRADNLVPNDSNGSGADIFLRDRSDRKTILVSGSARRSGNGDSCCAAISPDGRWVVFESIADDLLTLNSPGSPPPPADINRDTDIFLWELSSGKITLVSLNVPGTASANARSSTPSMSHDGRFVAFESPATNLAGNVVDTNLVNDIFVRDMQLGITTLLSRAALGSRSARSGSSPLISPNGRWIAFTSPAPDLAAGAAPESLPDLYLHDRLAGTNASVSAKAAPFKAQLSFGRSVSSRPVFAGDFLFFFYGDILSSRQAIVRWNLNTDSVDLIQTLSSGMTDTSLPRLSGSLLGASENGSQFIYSDMARTETGLLTSILVSTRFPALERSMATANWMNQSLPNGPSRSPVISASGSHAAFLSHATDLVTNQISALPQLYLHNLDTKRTELVTAPLVGPATHPTDAPFPFFDHIGRFLLFGSTAPGLVPGDQNNASDVFVRDTASGLTELISERSSAIPMSTSLGSSSAGANALSEDSRWLVFTSQARDTAPNDSNFQPDVFVRDLLAGGTRLISANSLGTGSGNGPSRDPVLSRNGRFVAFVSTASDLAQNDSNRSDDVLLRDLQTSRTFLVSASSSSAAGNSRAPTLSADGQFVAFQSSATNLVSNDSNLQPDIFLYDLSQERCSLVSVNSTGQSAANGPSESPLITPDGRKVLFQSRASNLTSPSSGGIGYRLYLRDLDAKTTQLISPPSSRPNRTALASNVVLSHDGQSVAFAIESPSSIYLRAFSETTNRLVCTNCFAPALSADGRFAAYQKQNSPSDPRDLFIKDLKANLEILVSANPNGLPANAGDRSPPAISPDGRFVLFKSRSSRLLPGDTNEWSDIFLRDLSANKTLSLSRGMDGMANGLSFNPIFSPNGQFVLFQSFASNLIPGDHNQAMDLLILWLNSPDSDNDGLPDDWEMAHLGHLNANSSDDPDRDGASNHDEYLAGTSPTNNSSVFRAFVLSSLSTGQTRVIWNSAPGRRYLVQYKNQVTDPTWTDLSIAIDASAEQSSLLDPSAPPSGHRFYRVQLLK